VRLPPGLSLSLNTSPALVIADRGLDAIVAASGRPVIVEVTEHEAVADYETLRRQLAALGAGVRIAVDDAGSGYASMRHIFALRPDIVKLDIEWVRDIDADPARQALVAGLVHVAAEIGADVIGEGIETEAERETLARLGVTYGQGFLLGRPAPATGDGA
jgi:EAL domain-containing protein (putative c-di-GMP-specific phosphodiesterase class I)